MVFSGVSAQVCGQGVTLHCLTSIEKWADLATAAVTRKSTLEKEYPMAKTARHMATYSSNHDDGDESQCNHCGVDGRDDEQKKFDYDDKPAHLKQDGEAGIEICGHKCSTSPNSKPEPRNQEGVRLVKNMSPQQYTASKDMERSQEGPQVASLGEIPGLCWKEVLGNHAVTW
jgi:hypothetical protein|tara:strand:- start:23347 stop:23862 length:516 start_codon:yes stop_codon:yes gene_type:complete